MVSPVACGHLLAELSWAGAATVPSHPLPEVLDLPQ